MEDLISDCAEGLSVTGGKFNAIIEMPKENENKTDLHQNLPTQLSQLIIESKRKEEQNGIVVADDEVELTSRQPVGVVEYFLSTNRNSWAQATFDDYSYDLTRFLEYCDYADLNDLSEVTSAEMEGFKNWRKKDENIGLATLHGQLTNIRVFVRSCERLNIVEEGVAESIDLPDLDNSDIVSYTRIRFDQAQAILDYYDRYDYACRAHAEFALMWACLCRLGGVRSLDLDDYCEDEEGDKYVEFTHDPDEETPLKNGESDVEGEGGEREVNVPDWVCEILDDYIEEHRQEVEDDYDRQPLFTTNFGRVSESTLQRDIYGITQPCQHGQDCPHDMVPSECDAKTGNQLLSRCPSSVSPHPVRRGAICYQIKNGVPKETICERADVSLAVLNKHYDVRTKEEARIQRRKELKQSLEGYESARDESETDGDRDQQPASPEGTIEAASPFMADLLSWKDQLAGSDDSDATVVPTGKTAKGLTAYSAYVAMTGLNFGLMGIGFNPITMDVVFAL